MNWNEALDEREAEIIRLDDHLDDDATRWRREEIDRRAVFPPTPLVTDDQALLGADEPLRLSLIVMLIALVPWLCVAVFAYGMLK